MEPIDINTLTYVGFVVKPYGFRGEVIIGLEDISPDDFGDVDYIFLKLEGLPVPFRVENSIVKNGNLILKLEDLNEEDAAKKLNGIEVYLDALVLESDDTPTYENLKGFEAIDVKEGTLGPILNIEELPMQLIAQCEFRGNELLFPLNDSIVTSIDTQSKRVFVALPEGLIDVYR
ncbi:MAG: rRNA processing protein RimM [Bacteroidota bacterium]|jgi:16S rRNA processing protein RimM